MKERTITQKSQQNSEQLLRGCGGAIKKLTGQSKHQSSQGGLDTLSH